MGRYTHAERRAAWSSAAWLVGIEVSKAFADPESSGRRPVAGGGRVRGSVLLVTRRVACPSAGTKPTCYQSGSPTRWYGIPRKATSDSGLPPWSSNRDFLFGQGNYAILNSC
jgi:hypothetical protein